MTHNLRGLGLQPLRLFIDYTRKAYPVGFLSPILTEASEDGKPVNGNNKICVPCHVAAMSRGRGARGAARQRVE